MAEIDIDKMLAQNEKKEKQKKNKTLMVTIGISAAVIVALVAAGIITAVLLIGEASSSYFPLKTGIKYTYNKKGKSPEEWHFLDKKENLYGYDCNVLVKSDKGSYTTRQEYYYIDKENGYARLAYSENYGQKIKDVFVILPYNVKEGKEWNAGKIKDKIIKASIVSKEKLITAAGEAESYRVDYKAAPYMDMSIWFSKDIGIVKEVNNMTTDVSDLISYGE